MSQPILNSSERLNQHRLERKAIDLSGRVGSLYDASTDTLVDQANVEASETKIPEQRSISEIYTGVLSNEETTFLEKMGFDSALRQSILLQMITPSGVCRLIDYYRPIDQNTHFLYYSYSCRIQKLHITAQNVDQIIISSQSSTRATHMITRIVWGFEVLCVIQIPKDQLVNTVDQLLHCICDRLQSNNRPFSLTDDERHQLNELTDVTIYGSETCVDQPDISICTVLDRITYWESNTNFHQPLKYTMQSLRWLYKNDQFSQLCSWPIQSDSQLDLIEPILIKYKNQIKYLQEMFQSLPTHFSSEALNQSLADISQQFSFLLNTRENFQEHLRQVLVDIRRHHAQSTVISEMIFDQRYICLQEVEMEIFYSKMKRLFGKVALLEKLERDQIQYINVLDMHSGESTIKSIDRMIKHSLSGTTNDVILWYSSDHLKYEQTQRWKQTYRNLIAIRRQKKSKMPVGLIYVDFTQCQQRLDDFQIITLSSREKAEIQDDSGIAENAVSPLPSVSSDRSSPRSLSPSSDSQCQLTEINVLLLGEADVDKSIFINAFINYLTFDTLENAEQNEPIVATPISFLTTIGDQFDELIVKFGNIDVTKTHATPHCKSYLLDLNDRSCLRLIDTPDIPDNVQMEKTIDHILTYINNLTHLNAICILVKSNDSSLNISFRSCVHQLLTYLNPVAYGNILFCSTNIRTTFDATRLLEQIFDPEQSDNISFDKENTFCIGSESFRYLVARKSGVILDQSQRRKCSNSWVRSTNESCRLLHFIETRRVYNLTEWVSIRKALLDISTLVRPLMETLRLMIYNWKFSDDQIIDQQIILQSNPIDREMCSHCVNSNIVDMGPFWRMQYQPTVSENNPTEHDYCPSDSEHFLIEYIIHYQLVEKSITEMNDLYSTHFLYTFLLTCDRLLQFTRQQQSADRNDPFGCILERFIEEEQQICRTHSINQKIYEGFMSIKLIRQRNNQELSQSNERLSVNDIYQLINDLIVIPTVQKQMDSINESRQLKMKLNECRIPTNRTFDTSYFQ